MKTLVHNIGLLATPQGVRAKGGAEQGDILTLQDAYVLMQNGIILDIGQGTAPIVPGARMLDAGGALATPGLIDAHTHLVFGGWREHELSLKLEGVPYLDILKNGGGILSTVRATRKASEESLLHKARGVLEEMLKRGTTTCEGKSGYGLDMVTELMQLEVMRRLNECQPVHVVPTFMGAHAVPQEYQGRPDDYVTWLVQEMIPLVAQRGLARFCDVFCEDGVFDVAQSRRVLRAAQAVGLGARIHTDEISAIGGSLLAGEIGCVSAEHLIAADDEGIRALGMGGVIACLLPATSLYLGKPYARARDMVKAGVPVCVATDFNPGSCPGANLQLVMNLACWQYRLLPAEVLTAVTLNAAASVGMADEIGTLQTGKRADMILWDCDNLDYPFYRFGDNLVSLVIKNGEIVHRA